MYQVKHSSCSLNRKAGFVLYGQVLPSCERTEVISQNTVRIEMKYEYSCVKPQHVFLVHTPTHMRSLKSSLPSTDKIRVSSSRNMRRGLLLTQFAHATPILTIYYIM